MFRLTLLLTTLLLVAACSNPATDKPRALTNEAAPVASLSPAQGERYSITPDTSKIEFVGSKVTGSHNGSFKKFSGAIVFTGQPEGSSVNVKIDTTSIETDTPDLTKHLKTPDFFDVAKYPEATFAFLRDKSRRREGHSHHNRQFKNARRDEIHHLSGDYYSDSRSNNGRQHLLNQSKGLWHQLRRRRRQPDSR